MRENPAQPITLREPPPSTGEAEEGPSYRLFVFSSLTFASLGGFALAVALPLSSALQWNWGWRWAAMAQAHGQVQLLGWAGLFAMGMAYRLMPRFSGRPLAFPFLQKWSWGALVASLLLRMAAQPAEVGVQQQTFLILSGALGLGAALAFAAVVFGTLLHRHSRAEATGYFFVAAAAAFVVQAAVELADVSLMAQRDENVVRYLENDALLFLQVYGFLLMLIMGVGTRAVPTFSGLPRPNVALKLLCLSYCAVVVAYVTSDLWRATGSSSVALVRTEDAALVALAPVFVTAVWLTGIFRPAAIRLRPASQPHLWFLRSAFAWLLVAGGLAAYYGGRGVIDGAPTSTFAADAIRHSISVGVVTAMVMGMSMLVLPEHAARRMHHPDEPFWPLTLALMLNLSAALRLWPALAGLHWLDADRYWPMAAAGTLGEAAVLVYAALFIRNYLELRRGIVPLPPAGPARTGADSAPNASTP